MMPVVVLAPAVRSPAPAHYGPDAEFLAIGCALVTVGRPGALAHFSGQWEGAISGFLTHYLMSANPANTPSEPQK